MRLCVATGSFLGVCPPRGPASPAELSAWLLSLRLLPTPGAPGPVSGDGCPLEPPWQLECEPWECPERGHFLLEVRVGTPVSFRRRRAWLGPPDTNTTHMSRPDQTNPLTSVERRLISGARSVMAEQVF